MYHPVKTIQDFTKSLAGSWLNPRTKNKFYFFIGRNNGPAGKINVWQQGADQPVSLHFDLSASAEKIFMTVEGERYTIPLKDVPANSLYIKLSADTTLRLLRH